MKNKKTCAAEKFTVKLTQNILLLITVLCLLFQINTAKAQDGEMDEYKPFNAGLSVKNMHIWHGFVVHPGMMWAGNMEYKSKSKRFVFGFWGGSSFSTGSNGQFYRELSIYTKYDVSETFFVELVTHNNYSGITDDKIHYWNYGMEEPKNFLDLNFGLSLGNAGSLYLATILLGHSGDNEMLEGDTNLTASYTHFLQYSNKIWEHNNASLEFVLGSAWSFLTKKSFYTNNGFNVIEVALKYTDKVQLSKNFKLPISATTMWNPEKEIAVLEVGIGVF